jgi:hypothetical protein
MQMEREHLLTRYLWIREKWQTMEKYPPSVDVLTVIGRGILMNLT